VVIDPRTAGMGTVFIHRFAAAVAYPAESMPWICTSLAASTDMTNATTIRVRFSRLADPAQRSTGRRAGGGIGRAGPGRPGGGPGRRAAAILTGEPGLAG
jgi:hypothetical protein